MYRASLPTVFAIGLVAALGTHRADAADYLRGAYAGETAPRAVAAADWGGFYGGIHAGYSALRNTPGSMSAPAVSTTGWPAGVAALMPAPITGMSPVTKNGVSYGAFAGVNYLWDDVVLGYEADYTHNGIKANASSGPTTYSSLPAPSQYTLTNTQTIKARVTDYATLRGRVGYAMGMFMPYVTLGVAAGYADTHATNAGSWVDTVTPANGTYSVSRGKKGLIYGAAYGAGVDMQFWPNTFFRAEWQGIQFAQRSGRPDLMIQSGRVGGGVKF